MEKANSQIAFYSLLGVSIQRVKQSVPYRYPEHFLLPFGSFLVDEAVLKTLKEEELAFYSLLGVSIIKEIIEEAKKRAKAFYSLLGVS